MATKAQQRYAKANGKHGGTTMVNVFKRPANIALVLVVATLYVTIGTWVLTSEEKESVAVDNGGLVIAYYQNDYQRYAIEELTKRDQLEQYPCLHELWTKESNWRPKARNKSSNAYGIAQLLPITWKLVEFKQTDDGYTQVDAGLAYIKRKYGSGGAICRAYAHHLAKGWY
jgi:hypothetical protein